MRLFPLLPALAAGLLAGLGTVIALATNPLDDRTLTVGLVAGLLLLAVFEGLAHIAPSPEQPAPPDVVPAE